MFFEIPRRFLHIFVQKKTHIVENPYMKNKVKLFLQFRASMQQSWFTPTEIGMELGKSYLKASAAVSPALKQLISEEEIKKRKKGRRVEYAHISACS